MTKYELEIKTNLLYQSAKAFEYTGHEDIDHCLDVILDYVKTILDIAEDSPPEEFFS